MLEKRDKPLMTWDELFALNGIEVTPSKDGKSHVFVEGVEIDETFNPFADFTYYQKTSKKKKRKTKIN